MATPCGATAEGTQRPFNNLLRRLSASDVALIGPHLAHEEAAANDLLYHPGDDLEIVHFPCGPSLATYLVSNEDGRDVETVLVGGSSVSRVIQTFKAGGVLETRACLCNESVKNHFEEVLRGVYPSDEADGAAT